ncbi:GUN4 domain-containing protein [Anabaena sp. PCC 7938]|nr:MULTISPECIES: GUN4 domain-containing protein [Anabaena]MCM2404926.1 GUN4 domain-containing protein [Anabaena sp. CCAP 1446/1C]
MAANLYKRLNKEFSYRRTINYIQYVQSKYFEDNFEDDDEYYQFIFNSNNKSLEVNNVDLKSTVGMNYTRLRDLLAAGKWKEADEETTRVMLAVAKRENQGWLDFNSIDNFPCEDLATIDKLWVNYSNGRFGFSVQKRIYQNLGGTRQYDDKIWDVFGETVGWRKGGYWLSYKDITFDKKVPEFHLPLSRFWVVGVGGGWGILVGIFSRVETCKLFLVEERQPQIILTPEPVNQDVQLKSSVGMDYRRLTDLLKAGKWKEADEETTRLMLAFAKREKEGWLNIHSIDNFPCEDLHTIDQLWVTYSDDKFGFSVQTQLYRSLGGTREYDSEIWRKFGEKVGWRKEGYWLSDIQLFRNFRTYKVPEGYLPVGVVFVQWFMKVGWGWGGVSSVASRLVKCNI